jgi:predicted permease
MPPEFFGAEAGRRFEVALPLCASGFERPDHWWLAVMGRLKSGWSERLAHAHLATLGPQLLGAAMPPTYNAEQARQFVNLKFTVGPARNGVSPLREQYEEPLWILLAIAALVLIAAAVNVANLSLVRGIAREPEFGLRFALGASRARVFRQLLVEGALVAIAGAAVGLVLARTAQRTVLALLSTSTDRVVLDVGPDWRVFGLTAGLVGLTTLAFALTPALRRVHARHATAAWSRATPGRKWASARELLVAVQVALAVVLVSGAVVFVLTARNLFSADRGFDETNLLFAHVFMAEADHPPEGRAAGQRELTERLRHLPGIAAVAHTSTPPLGGFSWGTVVRVRTAEGEITDEANRNQVSAGYFETMQLALRKGRDFSDHDTPASPRVAVINETFAQKFFPGGQALGQRFAEGDQEFTVIGIVRDSKQYMLRESFRPIAYTAASQVATPSTTIRFVVRAHGTVGKSIEGVRKVVADFSPSAGLRFATGADVVAGSMQTERLMATLSGCFGAIAILLSAVGVFGLVSYTVTSREREIGIRLALGARVSHVMVTVLGRMSAVAGVGLLAGALLTIPASGLATSLLYGVQLTHPRVMALILGTIIGAGLLAALAPVRRALGTDPVIALRAE